MEKDFLFDYLIRETSKIFIVYRNSFFKLVIMKIINNFIYDQTPLKLLPIEVTANWNYDQLKLQPIAISTNWN